MYIYQLTMMAVFLCPALNLNDMDMFDVGET